MMVHLELDPLSTEINAQVETDELLVLKIYLQGDPIMPMAIRIELTSEQDVQLYY
jgi:hypothetical protein